MTALINTGETGLIPITDNEFIQLSELIYQRFGIVLDETKRSLLVGRLHKILRRHGIQTFGDYYAYLLRDRSGKAVSELANQISTNHTYFNREPEHFRFLVTKALPDVVARLRRQKKRDIRVWCAAAATGEEPYLLAMLLMEFFAGDYENWQAGLLATDISAAALARARHGVYAPDQVNKLSVSMRHKYFTMRDDGQYEVVPAVKRDVVFRRFNLMNQSFPFRRPFDIIFCRNVMIYFDKPTKTALAERMFEFTSSGGYLFIGHSETLTRSETPYTYVTPAVYQRCD